MEILISIIFLVFAILQIMLFFKLWGMTNNTKRIYESITHTNNSVGYWLLLGEKEKAFEIVKKDLVDALISCRQTCFEDQFAKAAQKIIDKSKERAALTGYDLPDILANPEKFKEYYDKLCKLPSRSDLLTY